MGGGERGKGAFPKIKFNFLAHIKSGKRGKSGEDSIMRINIPIPELQIDFSFVLTQIRSFYLGEALNALRDEY